MAASSVIKNMADGSIILKDGTGTPIAVTIKFDKATFTVTGLKYKLRETVTYQHRGILSSVRHTGRLFPTFSFACDMSEFTAATAVSGPDAILKNGAFAAAVSTLGASADVYTMDVVVAEEGTNFGDSADPTFTLEDCELSLDYSQGDPNSFAFNGICYGAIVGDLAM